MMQSKAKIFLANERGIKETCTFQSMSTFNFGTYYNEHKLPIGNLQVINEYCLNPCCSLTVPIEKSSYLILLPVIGAINYIHSAGNNGLIAAGQSIFFLCDECETLEISNPFNNGVVNFLMICIRNDKRESCEVSALSTFAVNHFQDTLYSIFPQPGDGSSLPFNLLIGKFDGRCEATYCRHDERASLFAFVIEGAFEIEGRLLHAGDGLSLTETNAAEIEALSNDAIILVVESL